MIIGRAFHFDSSHYLKGHEKCGCVHGHTWKLQVAVKGPVDPLTGMVADFHKIKALVSSTILENLDHKLINDEFPEGHVLHDLPTCENLAVWIAETLAMFIPEPIETLLIKLQEGTGGWAIHEYHIQKGN